MSRHAVKCLYCGRVAPPRAKRCPACGYELVDRNAWYNRCASNFAGAFLGAAAAAIGGPVLLLIFADLGHIGAPDAERGAAVAWVWNNAFSIVGACMVVGILIGFFAWDRMRGGIESAASTAADGSRCKYWW